MPRDIVEIQNCVFGKISNGEKARKIKVYSTFVKSPKTAILGEKSVFGVIFLVFGKSYQVSREFWLRHGVSDWGLVIDEEKIIVQER